MKKIYLVFFCGLMCVATITANAQDWSQSTNITWYIGHESESTYTITTADQLAGLAQLVNGDAPLSGKTITLGADIILNNTSNWQNWTTTPPARSWTAIGKTDHSFSGTFDGNGYTISGVYINNSSNDQGLFGYLGPTGTIKNLAVTASYVEGGEYVGGLVGDNRGSITNCYATGNVTGSSYVGGLAGYSSGTIRNCYATGNITGSTALYNYQVYVGGLVGYQNSGTITNCYASGDVVNINSNSDSVIRFYYNYGGGLVGYQSYGAITNCYATGNITGTGNYIIVGGLVGYSGTITFGYYNSETAGTGSYGTPKTTAEMQSQNFVKLLNLNSFIYSLNKWTYMAGAYPAISGAVISGADVFAGGEGTVTNPYTIRTKEQLENLSYIVNNGFNFSGKYIRLDDDISLNNVSNFQNWATTPPDYSWTPIGTSGTYPFNGTFDGNGKVISGIYINSTSNIQGLFGYVNSGTIRNLGVAALYVKGNQNIGGLAGYSGGTIANCYVAGNVAGTAYVGGLAGQQISGSITNCYAIGEVIGTSNVGGLVGYKTGGTITNCYAAGNVSGSSSVGGLVGINNYGTITSGYYDMETSKQYDNSGKGVPKSTEDMQLQATYTGWDFSGVWTINGGYPYLQILGPTKTFHTVSFSLNGGSGTPPPIITGVPSGSTLTTVQKPPTNYTRTSYENDGKWYTDPAGTIEFVFGTGGTPVTSNITLYLKWMPVYTVSFSLNGGSGTPPSSITVAPGNTIPVAQKPSTSGITRSGYVNDGNWYTSSVGTTEFVFGTGGTPVNGDIMLYLRWTPVYTVSFNLNSTGVTGTTPTPITGVMPGSTLTTAQRPSTVGFAKTGYLNDGKWYRNSNGTNEFVFGTGGTPVESNMTLYLYWTPTTYNITYNLNGGTNHPSNPLTYTIESVNITLQSPTQTSYTFDRWYDSNTGGNQVTSIPSGSTGNRTLWARWFVNIITQPAATTNVIAGSITGDLTVAANAANSVTPSYQWYSNTTNSNTVGMSLGTSARNAIFTIPTTLTAGTYYYFCEVSATGSTSVRSSVAIVTVAKSDGAIVSTPTVDGTPTQTSITVNTVTLTPAANGQLAEYAITTSTSTTLPTGLTWQNGTLFSGLTAGTTYYVWVRSAETTNYDAGTAQRSAGITTLKINVTNSGGAATVTYAGAAFDLSTLATLFTVDASAGARTYTIEAGSTETGTIGADGKTLTVTKAGTFNIGLTTAETATYAAGVKVTATLTVNKGIQNAPIGLGKTDITVYGGSNGTITGVTAAMEYKSSTAGNYMAVIGTTITGLSAGSYLVRYAATDLYNESADAPVDIEQPKIPVINTAGSANVAYAGTTFDLTATSGLFTLGIGAGMPICTIETGSTGTGTIGTDGKTLTVTKAGTFNIGLTTAETATYAAGAKVTAILTVNKGTQNAPIGLGKTDVTVYGGSNGTITGVTTAMEYKLNTAGNYTAATGTTITGLSAGSYLVRYTATDLYNESADAEVVVGQPVQTFVLTVIAGAYGSVSGTASGNYTTGTAVSITATANSGYRFTGWTVAGATIAGGNTANPATFNMPANAVTITANFEMITYTVTVLIAGTGAMGSGNYPAGATVSINAGTPPAGQQFKNWTSTSAGVTFANANNASTTFVMPANAVTVTANFEPITYAVTVSSAGTGATGSGNYAAGATVSINAGTPPAGQQFKNWTANAEVSFANENSASTTFTMPANAVTVTAQWTPIKYTITYILNGGINHPDNPAEYTIESQTITLQNPTRIGYDFAGWVEGSSIPTGSTGDKTFTAEWTDIRAITSVTVTPANVSVKKGDKQQFSATVVATGGASLDITWSIAGHALTATNISATGLLTVAADETANTLTVTAISVFDNTKKGTTTVRIENVTGVETADTPLARVYPNPTDGTITIETRGFIPLSDSYILTISDINGKILLRQTVSDQITQLDVSAYPSGVYLLTIDDGKRQSVMRVVKN